jgi:hypothetical protein
MGCKCGAGEEVIYPENKIDIRSSKENSSELDSN